MKMRQLGQKLQNYRTQLGHKFYGGVKSLGHKVYDNRYIIAANLLAAGVIAGKLASSQAVASQAVASNQITPIRLSDTLRAQGKFEMPYDSIGRQTADLERKFGII